jgi:hypothetical protein
LFDLSKAENLLKRNIREAALKFSSYDWASIQEYMKNLEAEVKRYNPSTCPAQMFGKYTSFNFVKPEYQAEESYWLTALVEIFNKYNLK